MSFQITVLSSAWDDLKSLLEFYHKVSGDQVLIDRMADYVVQSIETLQTFPERHAVAFYRHESPVYKMTLSKFPILIYYFIDHRYHTVVVAQIRHAKENPQTARRLFGVDEIN